MGSTASVNVAVTDSVALRMPPWFGCGWLLGLILVLAVILAYQPVWHAGFIWDDDVYITASPCIIGLHGLKEIWTTSAADISPLTFTTFWVEHALWGLAPLPYHLVNVLLHGACAVLLWRVLLSLKIPGAWLGAALWALHPVEVESVAWITEMKNTESGLFFLLSILFFVKWLRTKDLKERIGGGWYYALTLVFAALAMASKSSTVILPVALCLCAWWIEGRWHWRNLARVIPVFLMSIAASALSIWTQNLHLGAHIDPQFVRSWPERLATAGDAVWFYLGKLIWPHPLITIYPRWKIDAGQVVSYLPLLAVIVVLFILWLKRDSWLRPCFFIFAYFLAALLPVLGLIDNPIFHYSLVFDHFQYLASMGPLALAGAGIVRLSDFVNPGKSWLLSSLCAGLLLILGLLSWQRAWVYESHETLWTDALAKNPNCWVGHGNLGEAFFQKGQVDKAVAQFKTALEINSNYADAYNNLGAALAQKGQVDEAIAQFQKALRINPNYVNAHSNLGVAFIQKGRVDEAMAQFRRALEINPNDAEAHSNLGAAFFQKGWVDEAMTQYQKALGINPNDGKAHYNLGFALVQRGQVDEAIVHFQKALELNPNDAKAHYNLGIALIQKERMDEAIVHFQMGLKIDPNNADAFINLGLAKEAQGDLDGALLNFRRFGELAPRAPNADYAHLWIWIIRARQNQKEQADQELDACLSKSWNASLKDWVTKNAAFLLNRMSEGEYLAAAGSADAKTDRDQHCEAWYYAGMKRLLANDRLAASDDFHKCLATGKADFAEFWLAGAELKALASSH